MGAIPSVGFHGGVKNMDTDGNIIYNTLVTHVLSDTASDIGNIVELLETSNLDELSDQALGHVTITTLHVSTNAHKLISALDDINICHDIISDIQENILMLDRMGYVLKLMLEERYIEYLDNFIDGLSQSEIDDINKTD